MSASLIDGRAVAKGITERATRDVKLLGFAPGFAAVLVGDDPASHLYVSLKERACRAAGIHFEKLFFAVDAPQATVVRAIEALNARPDIDAILVQLPLPDGLDTDTVIRSIAPEKDVDGFHPENVALLKSGAPRIVPGLAAAVMALVRAAAPAEGALSGRTALVVANSPAFYEPLETVLASAGLAPSFAQPHDPTLPARAVATDVLVVAVGRAGFVTPGMVKPGAIVIDIGTNEAADPAAKNGKRVVGDVSPEAAARAGHVTPVPGGVGPVTVAMVVRNCVELAKKRRA